MKHLFICFSAFCIFPLVASLVAQSVKNPPPIETAYNAGDLALIPGLRRFPGEGNRNPFHILAWEITWTEDPGGLQSMGSQESDMTEGLNHHQSVRWVLGQLIPCRGSSQGRAQLSHWKWWPWVVLGPTDTCTFGSTLKTESEGLSTDVGGLCRQPHQRHRLGWECASLTVVRDLPYCGQ